MNWIEMICQNSSEEFVFRFGFPRSGRLQEMPKSDLKIHLEKLWLYKTNGKP